MILEIKTNIESIDGEKNTIDFVTEASVYQKNHAIFMVYEETELSGMEGSKTMLKLKDKKVFMHRFGSVESKIIFDKENAYTSDYITPHGRFELKVETMNLDYDINEDGTGFISIDYKMVLENISSSENHLRIRIKNGNK